MKTEILKVRRGTKKTVTYEEYEEFEISTNFVQMYECVASYQCKISTMCASQLLTFIVLEMDKTNSIISDKSLRVSFNEYLKTNNPNHNGYADDTIKKALCELKEVGLLIQQCIGKYIINPNVFWKGSSGDRKKNILGLGKGNGIKLLN